MRPGIQCKDHPSGNSVIINTPLTSSDLDPLKDAIETNSTKSFLVRCCTIDIETATVIINIMNETEISSLMIKDCSIGPDEFMLIMDAVKMNKTLEEIDFCGNTLYFSSNPRLMMMAISSLIRHNTTLTFIGFFEHQCKHRLHVNDIELVADAISYNNTLRYLYFLKSHDDQELNQPIAKALKSNYSIIGMFRQDLYNEYLWRNQLIELQMTKYKKKNCILVAAVKAFAVSNSIDSTDLCHVQDTFSRIMERSLRIEKQKQCEKYKDSGILHDLYWEEVVK